MANPDEGIDPRGPRLGQALTGSLTRGVVLTDVPVLIVP